MAFALEYTHEASGLVFTSRDSPGMSYVTSVKIGSNCAFELDSYSLDDALEDVLQLGTEPYDYLYLDSEADAAAYSSYAGWVDVQLVAVPVHV